MKKDRIERVPGRCAGMPVIKGTRIQVALIREKLKAGQSVASILRDYPRLKRADVEACRG